MLEIKERLSFQVMFARRWYAGDEKEGRPVLMLQLKPMDYRLRKHLGKRPATARILQHQTGRDVTELGIVCGKLEIGKIRDENEIQSYAEITALMTPENLNSLSTTLINGGHSLLSRTFLQIALKENKEKIDSEWRNGSRMDDATYFVEDVLVRVDVGEEFDELA
jgi:hypothetical protein